MRKVELNHKTYGMNTIEWASDIQKKTIIEMKNLYSNDFDNIWAYSLEIPTVLDTDKEILPTRIKKYMEKSKDKNDIFLSLAIDSVNNIIDPIYLIENRFRNLSQTAIANEIYKLYRETVMEKLSDGEEGVAEHRKGLICITEGEEKAEDIFKNSKSVRKIDKNNYRVISKDSEAVKLLTEKGYTVYEVSK